MKLFKCDKCGKIIKGKGYFIEILVYSELEPSIETPTECAWENHFCKKCFEKLTSFFKKGRGK